MRARRYFTAVDSHTEGMPTRVITGGLGPVPGDSMQERRLYFERHLDDLRLLLMREPRGHSAMSGAFLQPATRPDADWGVLFVEVSGLLPMCGHGTIGVATVLVETGMVEVSGARDPDPARHASRSGRGDRDRLPTAGRSASRCATCPRSSRRSTPRSRVYALGGLVRYDMAYGGNFYALVPAEPSGSIRCRPTQRN